MPRYKVSLSTGVTLGSERLLNLHHICAPPAPTVPGVALEYPVPNFWPPGSAMGQNKLTRRVMHRGATIVQDGHDVGTMIPHLSFPAYNVLMPVHMLFSKRKAAFFETAVRFESRFAVSCDTHASPPTPMMSCNDPIALPIATTAFDWLNTVEFGMSMSSYMLSLAAMAASMAVDTYFARMPDGKAVDQIKELLSRFDSKLVGGSAATPILLKLGIENGIGLTKLLATSGERTVSFTAPGGPFIRASASAGGPEGPDGKLTLHGFDTHGGSAWADTAARMGGDTWGADLG